MVAGNPYHTLRKNEQFRICYARGKKVVCDHVVVFYYPMRDGAAGGVGVGVVASKRVGNSVKRSRAKRLLRVAARHVADRLNDRDLWVVLVAKSSIIAQSSHIVQNDLERGLNRAGLLESPFT